MRFLDAIFLENVGFDAIAIPDQHKRLVFTHLLTRGITCFKYDKNAKMIFSSSRKPKRDERYSKR